MLHPLRKLLSEFFQKYGTAVGFCSLVFIGFGLYLFGHFHAPAPVNADGNLVWYAQISFDVGRMILVGAILGAFVRFLHTFRAIREVVTEVFSVMIFSREERILMMSGQSSASTYSSQIFQMKTG